MSNWTYERLSSDEWELRSGPGDMPERRRHYRLSNGEAYFYVVADFAYTFDHGPETMIFDSDSLGNIWNWSDILMLADDAVTDDSAIMMYVDDLNSRTERLERWIF